MEFSGLFVPLTQSAIAALKLYLKEGRSLFVREAGQVRLFVSTRSRGPLDDHGIMRIVAKAANRAGIRKRVTPHTLRHTCATHLLKAADIRQIQKLLGHRRLSSTEVYTRVELTAPARSDRSLPSSRKAKVKSEDESGHRCLSG